MWPRLSHVGQQRVVAGIFPVMGIEAAKGPAHSRPCAHHGAIDVDRQPRQRAALDRVGDEVVPDQRRHRGLRELAQPVADGARRRGPRQPAEARDQGIAGDIAEMLQAAERLGADVEVPARAPGVAAARLVVRHPLQPPPRRGRQLHGPLPPVGRPMDRVEKDLAHGDPILGVTHVSERAHGAHRIKTSVREGRAVDQKSRLPTPRGRCL
jgi:hypothetical protein